MERSGGARCRGALPISNLERRTCNGRKFLPGRSALPSQGAQLKQLRQDPSENHYDRCHSQQSSCQPFVGPRVVHGPHTDMTDSHVPLDALLREASWLRRLCGALTRCSADADDLAQDVLGSALRQGLAPDERRPSPRAWLATIARRRAGRIRQREGGRRAVELWASANAEPQESSAHSPQARAHDYAVLQRELADTVASLPEPDRMVIVARYFEAKAFDEIASELSVTADTVRQRHTRAVRKLRARLAADDERWSQWLPALAVGGTLPMGTEASAIVAAPSSAGSSLLSPLSLDVAAVLTTCLWIGWESLNRSAPMAPSTLAPPSALSPHGGPAQGSEPLAAPSVALTPVPARSSESAGRKAALKELADLSLLIVDPNGIRRALDLIPAVASALVTPGVFRLTPKFHATDLCVDLPDNYSFVSGDAEVLEGDPDWGGDFRIQHQKLRAPLRIVEVVARRLPSFLVQAVWDDGQTFHGWVCCMPEVEDPHRYLEEGPFQRIDSSGMFRISKVERSADGPHGCRPSIFTFALRTEDTLSVDEVTLHLDDQQMVSEHLRLVIPRAQPERAAASHRSTEAQGKGLLPYAVTVVDRAGTPIEAGWLMVERSDGRAQNVSFLNGQADLSLSAEANYRITAWKWDRTQETEAALSLVTKRPTERGLPVREKITLTLTAPVKKQDD